MTSPEVIFTICRRTTASPYHILKSLISVTENGICDRTLVDLCILTNIQSCYDPQVRTCSLHSVKYSCITDVYKKNVKICSFSYLASAYCACLSASVLCTGLSLEDSRLFARPVPPESGLFNILNYKKEWTYFRHLNVI